MTPLKSPSDAWNPGQYDRFKNERTAPFFDLLALCGREGVGDVIDLGCGTGELTALLGPALGASTVTGMDSSASMLAKAPKGLRVLQGDIQNWEEKSSYDLIFSNAALQWCSDHPALFRRIRDSLRPGGQIAIQMPVNHDYPTHQIARALAAESPWTEKIGPYGGSGHAILGADVYASLLYRLGFPEPTVMVKVYGHILPNREGVIEWVRGTLLTWFQSRLSAEDYPVFERQFRERLFAVLPDEKPFFYPFKRILMVGRLPKS